MTNRTSLLTVFLLCLTGCALVAQTTQEQLSRTISQKDSLFWMAYNACDIEKARPLLSRDVEFYHDKGGLTVGKENLMNSLKKNLCGDSPTRLRREAINGSVQVFPLQNGSTTYGALISGEHVFYIVNKDGTEYLNGMARFTHMWTIQKGDWQMSRILSYDHRPAVYTNKRSAINLSSASLDQYAGTYAGPNTGAIHITKGEQSLVASAGNHQYQLYFEKEAFFFVKDRDLTFEFVRSEKGKIAKLIIREGGKIVEEATSTK